MLRSRLLADAASSLRALVRALHPLGPVASLQLGPELGALLRVGGKGLQLSPAAEKAPPALLGALVDRLRWLRTTGLDLQVGALRGLGVWAWARRGCFCWHVAAAGPGCPGEAWPVKSSSRMLPHDANGYGHGDPGVGVI